MPKIDVRTIDDKCMWKVLLNDEKSSTRDSVLKSESIKSHPLYSCYVCSGYETLKCLNYRVIKNER